MLRLLKDPCCEGDEAETKSWLVLVVTPKMQLFMEQVQVTMRKIIAGQFVTLVLSRSCGSALLHRGPADDLSRLSTC